ncbi:MAG TPA: helix-turn-helix domain-containing protein [Dehalococcoidia bacterium]|jgi:excisionase family DNA binding protein|nr:helix-turn-helix domain-containing protein [Dehalococcoidia bacterium]
MSEEQGEYITASEAARDLRVSRTTIWRWVREGRLAAYHVGGRTLRIRRDDVQKALRPVIYDPEGIRKDELWLDYDPAVARDALRQAAGILAGVDTAALKKDIRESREQKSRGRPNG